MWSKPRQDLNVRGCQESQKSPVGAELMMRDSSVRLGIQRNRPSSRLYKDGSEFRKYPMSYSTLGNKALLMPEVSGEWLDSFKRIEKQQ
ncbi:hypothetical protein NFI96_021925 [Prochilodus magdalenae]|nr:hypothetical protein NFI96_021925 [Prochilodus magdalenae]